MSDRTGEATGDTGAAELTRTAAQKRRPAAKRARVLAWLSLILRLSVGGILIFAGLPKLLHPGQFADIVANYRILP